MRAFGFLAASTALLFANGAWADQSPGAYGPHMWGDGWHGWFLGPISMILFLAIAVIVVLFVVRRLWGGDDSAAPARQGRKHALDILSERFARGEIDKAEFDERKQVLSE